MEQRDLVIIGGGPAGYIAAIRAKQLGNQVTLIERDALGGTCLNCGCIPTRTMVRAVEFLDLARKAKDYGVNIGSVEVDFNGMIARKDTVVRTLVGGVELLMRENGIEVLKGTGRFISASEVEVQLPDGTVTQVTAPKLIIATGSRSKRPPIPGIDWAITTEQALALSDIPRSLVISGAGPIAFTFATIFSRLGTKVMVVESSEQILPDVDREIVSVFEKELKKLKIEIYTGAGTEEISVGEDEEKHAKLTTRDGEITLTSQHVLVADDRESNLDGLGLERAGVQTEDHAIKVNSRMETSITGIFAAGDAVGGYLLAHVAFAEGKVAAENSMGKPLEIDYSNVPRCIYTTPEIASIGLTEEVAIAEGYETRIGCFPFAANGMATLLGERTGSIKIISDADYGQILGVHIIGPHASELIAEASLAMKLEATPQEIGSTIHAHPTLSEALMEAALDTTGEALHFLSPNRQW